MHRVFRKLGLTTEVEIGAVLVGLYVAAQMLADITAAKIMAVGPWTVPAGTLVYAWTFTNRDLIHKQLGKRVARLAIVLAGVINVLMAIYFGFAIVVPPAAFWQNQEAFAATLGIVPRIVVASILAEVISELVDTELYHLWVSRVTRRYQWARVAFSNLISVPLDSLLFVVLAFFGNTPLEGMLALILGQTVFKWLVGAITMPFIYAIPEGKTSFSSPLESRSESG
jgi:uncharacterized integral membrane protein (TIGR00697 family)